MNNNHLYINKHINSEKYGKKEGKTAKIDKKSNWVLICIGFAIGLINGFFGGGGGMIAVPTLKKYLELNQKQSQATTMAIILPLSIVSSLIYVLNKSVENIPLITIGCGVILGGILGSFLLKILPEKVVAYIFSILMIIAGGRLLL